MQLPKGNAPGVSYPDYTINGVLADCYAPSTPSMRNIVDEVNDKALNQAPIVVVNLDASPVSSNDLITALGGNTVQKLQQVFVVKGGQVTAFTP